VPHISFARAAIGFETNMNETVWRKKIKVSCEERFLCHGQLER
jgi:hypothetical protein